jgi:serine protease Do
MKPKSHHWIRVVLTAAMITPAMALEAPEDNSPPPAIRQDAANLPEIKLQPEAIPAPKPQAAMLGVVSGEMPEMLVEHLQLQPGEGVIVRSLVPDGPACQAGVHANDVILKVAGKPVGCPLDISNQIAKQLPGDKIALDLIQKGKATRLDITLGVRPEEMAAVEPQPLDQLDLEGFPKDMADRIKKAIEGNLGGLNLQLGGADLKAHPQMEDAVRQLQLRMQGAMGQGLIPPDAAGHGKIRVQGGTLILKDPLGSVEVKSNDNSKEITVRDEQGKITWSGPWDTAQDRAAAPAEARERVERLNLDTDFKSTGLRLQMLQDPAKE